VLGRALARVPDTEPGRGLLLAGVTLLLHGGSFLSATGEAVSAALALFGYRSPDSIPCTTGAQAGAQGP